MNKYSYIVPVIRLYEQSIYPIIQYVASNPSGLSDDLRAVWWVFLLFHTMSSETEIAVRDGNFFVIDNQREKPRTIGQQKLLAYMNTQITLGQKADPLEIIKIFMKHAMTSKGSWVPDYHGKEYYTREECMADNPTCYPYRWVGDNFIPSFYQKYTIDSWEVKRNSNTWFNRAIGSMVKCGFLIVIPKGYILQRIEESKKK